MKTTLILVRHGQSQANLEARFAGHWNIPLTEMGHAQAENTARFLSDYPIDRIYSSDLCRSMETAAPLSLRTGLSVIPDPELREINAGLWEGKKFSELQTEFPESYGVWLSRVGEAHPEEGESVAAQSVRICQAVERILSKERGRCVALFTHAMPIRLLTAHWEGIPVEELHRVSLFGNASVTVVEVEETGDVRFLLRGYDGHQGELATRFPRGAV